MSQQPVHTMTHETTLACVDPWGRPVDIPTTLGYSLTDPYAVSLTFRSRTASVTWHVARTLLLQGLAAPVGDGDIHVFPSIDEDARAVTVMVLSSPDGRLVAELPSMELQEFLTRTFKNVPVGSEDQHLDLDGLVDALLTSDA